MTTAPNATETVALQKFREAIQDYEVSEFQKTDFYLLRWLRARDLNINKSKEMLQKHLEHDKTHDVANLSKWEPPSSFASEYFFDISTVSRKGLPVVFIPLGQWDMRKVIETGQKDVFLKYANYIFEMAEKKMQELGVHQAVVFYDYAGFSFRQVASIPAVNLTVEFINTCEDNYPGIFQTAIIINTAKIFNILYRFVQPVMSKTSKEILRLYGTNKSEWMPALLEVIGPDQLPVEYGGNLVRERPSYVADPNQKIVVTIKKGEKFSTEFQIDEPGTVFTWRFKTDPHEIGFVILLDEKETILDFGRVDTSGQEETGEFCVERAGKYTFVFDNGDSKKSKTLHYMINVTLSDA